jgi:hypothetical protein
MGASWFNLLVCASRTTTTKAGRGKQDTCQWFVGQAAIKTNRSDKTEIKKILVLHRRANGFRIT